MSDDGRVPCFRHYDSCIGALSKGARECLTMVGFPVSDTTVSWELGQNVPRRA